MRRFLLATAMCWMAVGAQAADMPDLPALRGGFTEGLSRSRVNWDGWYAGGQVGYESANMDFSRSIVSLSNFIFRNSVLQQPTSQWSVLSRNGTQGTSFGAFVGRNWQWEDIVVGVEANYRYVNSLTSSSANTISLAIPNPTGSAPPPNHSYTYNTTLTGKAAVTIKDITTFRARAGWAADNWLPYMFGGLAVGRMDVFRSVSINVTLRDDETVTIIDPLGNVTTFALPPAFYAIPSLSVSASEHKTNAFVAGWTAGLGFEYCLWRGMFVRGEWEYTKFTPIKDTPIALNSVKMGVGYKF
jgi:opacity protein-like surface antigen